MYRLDDKIDQIRNKTRKSVLLCDLIEQSEFDLDEGNILKTLCRIVNMEIEKEIRMIQMSYGKPFINNIKTTLFTIFKNITSHFYRPEIHE